MVTFWIYWPRCDIEANFFFYIEANFTSFPFFNASVGKFKIVLGGLWSVAAGRCF